MVAEYKYSLNKGSRKFNCPGCGQKRLVRYINNETKEYLHDSIGRCDRENNCGYHYKPKQYFTDNNIPFDDKESRFQFPNTKGMETWKRGNAMSVDYLPFEIMDKSVSKHERCNLFPFLESLFRKSIADHLCESYFIGTTREGNTAFWQVDITGNIRQCKTMEYLQDGHRNKSIGVLFAGKRILNDQEANLQQCFFGEFLLSLPENESKPVAIVESEKTAVIASVYYPDFIWIATGGKHGCRWTEERVCKVLAGRKVVLFPDLGAYDSWKAKSLLLAAVAGCKVAVSDILEQCANDSDRANGLDIADYLLRDRDGSGLALTDFKYPVMWDYTDGFKSASLQSGDA